MSGPSASADLFAHNFNLSTLDFLSSFKPPPERSLIGQSFMHELAREGDVLSAEVMMNAGGEIDLQDDEGKRPLHEAAFFGHLEMVKFLVTQGALLDAPVHPFGFTALYYAIQQSRYDAVAWLLERGARMNIADRLTGHGLLHIAAQKSDMRLAGLLISSGIDVFQEDKKGLTARDHAARAGHKQMETILLKVMEHHARFCA